MFNDMQLYIEPSMYEYKYSTLAKIKDMRIKIQHQEDEAISKAMHMVFGEDFELYPKECIAQCRVECYPDVDKYYKGDKLFLEIIKYKYNPTTGNFEGSYRIYN